MHLEIICPHVAYRCKFCPAVPTQVDNHSLAINSLDIQSIDFLEKGSHLYESPIYMSVTFVFLQNVSVLLLYVKQQSLYTHTLCMKASTRFA